MVAMTDQCFDTWSVTKATGLIFHCSTLLRPERCLLAYHSTYNAFFMDLPVSSFVSHSSLLTAKSVDCNLPFTIAQKAVCDLPSSHTSPTSSRHTVVCRVAQEASAPHREYIYRKKENVIFTPLYLGDPLSNWNQICYTVARQPGESTFHI